MSLNHAPRWHRARQIHSFGLSAVVLVGLLAGCTSMPDHFTVDQGQDPENQDEDVRFRATYYFRVYDYCEKDTNNAPPFRNDTLFRFRMTGKASAFNDVHFESGTLLASQIDPLAAGVAFDEENRRFYFISAQEAAADARRVNTYAELKKQLRLMEELNSNEQLGEDAKAIAKELSASIVNTIGRLNGSVSPPVKSVPEQSDGSGTMNAALIKTAQVADSAQVNGGSGNHAPLTSSSNRCQDLRRGYLVLGPEGSKEFVQDERLVLAMTSTGKPIIATLQELSGRILNGKRDTTSYDLSLQQMYLAISESLRGLDTYRREDTATLIPALDRAIKLFNEEAD